MPWKIKHVRTGLFYRPSRHGYIVNLSKNGKLYHNKPTEKQLREWLYNFTDENGFTHGYHYPVNLSDFELVQI